MGADRQGAPAGSIPARSRPNARVARRASRARAAHEARTAGRAAERDRHTRDRAAQGLPPHLADPAVAARVVALLFPDPASMKLAAASLRMTATAEPEVRRDRATPTS